jgi:predicted nucleic acid-binding protein
MTTSVTLDSNILIYATLEPETVKGRRAASIILQAAPKGILAVQALLEFVAVVRKKSPELLAAAKEQAATWAEIFEIASTTPQSADTALDLATRHKLQIWDAVILASAAHAGATHFLSEDLGDGETHLGVRIVNPFNLSEAELSKILDPK